MTTQCTIKLFGGLRQKAGKSEQEATGATIREALESIFVEKDDLRAAIFDGDKLRPHIRVMVNGRDSELSDGLETAVFAIFPPIAGG